MQFPEKYVLAISSEVVVNQFYLKYVFILLQKFFRWLIAFFQFHNDGVWDHSHDLGKYVMDLIEDVASAEDETHDDYHHEEPCNDHRHDIKGIQVSNSWNRTEARIIEDGVFRINKQIVEDKKGEKHNMFCCNSTT